MIRLRPTLTCLAAFLLSGGSIACNPMSGLSLEGVRYLIVVFSEVNGSGMTGSGGGGFDEKRQAFTFTGTIGPAVAGQRYEGHVHQGTCDAVFAVALTLPPMVGRVASGETAATVSIAVSLPDASVGAGFVLDVHTTVNGSDQRVSCGEMH